jgi:hypothetical protein
MGHERIFFYTVCSPATTFRARSQASTRQRIGQSALRIPPPDSAQAASKDHGRERNHNGNPRLPHPWRSPEHQPGAGSMHRS